MPTPWPSTASTTAAYATTAPATPAVFTKWPQGTTFTLSLPPTPWADIASITHALSRASRTSTGR